MYKRQVLRSPIVGCTSQELAELRIQYPDGLLYESVSAYAGENEIPEKELDPDKLCLLYTSRCV